MYDKKGRPIKGFERKSHIISVRLEPFEYEELQKVSRLTGKGKTEIMRAGLHLVLAEVKKQLGGK